MSTKTALHSVVSIICDCLTDLSAEDQARAIEAVCVSLGLARPALPTVQVEMMNGNPRVMNPGATRSERVLVVNAAARQRPRQLSAGGEITSTSEVRGYVRSLR